MGFFADCNIIKVVHVPRMLNALNAGVCSLLYCRFLPEGVVGCVTISGHSSEHKSACSNHPTGLRVDLAISLA